jgi:uncharacterized protein (TIGR02466 family)
MIKSEIQTIFPTPVYFSNLNRKLNSSELKFLNKAKKNVYRNEGNTTSKDTYVLNKKPFSKLKKELNLRIKEYFDKIICTKNKIKPCITQSWLNYTEENQFHHRHSHPNSIVSGVFYIDADQNFDKIYFFKEKKEAIALPPKNYNIFNSPSWWFPVKSNDIILFPSSLLHMVETKKGNNTRTSLAFNIFVEGTIGETRTLTELILK